MEAIASTEAPQQHKKAPEIPSPTTPTPTPTPAPHPPSPPILVEMPRTDDPVLQLLPALGLAFLLYTAIDCLLLHYLGDHHAAPIASLAILLLFCCVRATEGLRDGGAGHNKKVGLMLAMRTLLALLVLLAIRIVAAPIPVDPALWLLILSSGTILLLFRCVREREMMEGPHEDCCLHRLASMSIIAAIFCYLASPTAFAADLSYWFALGVISTTTLCCLYELFFVPPPHALPTSIAATAAATAAAV